MCVTIHTPTGSLLYRRNTERREGKEKEEKKNRREKRGKGRGKKEGEGREFKLLQTYC